MPAFCFDWSDEPEDSKATTSKPAVKTYFFGQTDWRNERPVATRLRAKTLHGAKMEATSRWCYENTVLFITERCGSDGRIDMGDAIYYKLPAHDRWQKGVAIAQSR